MWGKTPPDDKPQGAKGTIPNIHHMLQEARKANEDAAEKQMQAAVQFTGLTKETGHLKHHVYILTLALIAAAVAGWQMYLHLDDKIEHKLDYLNARIDNVVNGTHESATLTSRELEVTRKNKKEVAGVVSSVTQRQVSNDEEVKK